MDSAGKCNEIPDGCKTASSDYLTCTACHPGFTLNDGKCECSGELLINNDNYCSACHVPGCSRCYPDQTNICAECLSGLVNDNGICKCTDANQKPNIDGECAACTAENCLSCTAEGQCRVTAFSEKTLSEECNVEDCKDCLQNDGSEDVCLNCAENYFVSEGVCLECNVIGCLSCYSLNICQQCRSGMSIDSNGQCVCNNRLQAPYLSTSTCSTCYIGGCKQCRSAYACNVCKDPRAFVN